MSVISRQFAREILLSSAFVLVVLVALFAFFDLIGQLDEVGKYYSLSVAFLLTALSLPARIYEVMPIAVLLAAVYTMSHWASTSEFTVLRVAGMSPLRLAGALLLPGILIVGLTYAFGEYVSPLAQHTATEVKSLARNSTELRARGYNSGVWVRDVTTSETGEAVDRYVNVSNLVAGDEKATGAWRMFEFDMEGRLLRLIHARSAYFEPGKGWRLMDAAITLYPRIGKEQADVTDQKVEVHSEANFFLPTTLGPDILNVMTSKPEDMSMRDLDRYIAHLSRTGQQSENYEVAFWNKAFYPLAVLVMLALAMPFAYLNARSGGMAIKMFFGVMIGIGFYAMNHFCSYLGVLHAWSPIAVSVLPSAAMLAAATLALWWVERR